MLLSVVIANTYAKEVGPWNLDELYKVPSWVETQKAEKGGMTGILYQSLTYKGKCVQVFAYYNAPQGVMPEGGWPAVVCVHGGGGTAFDTWVKKWNDHGYAAISMDLEGHYPLKDSIDGKWQRLPTENPGISRVGTFMDFELPIKDQWYYNAVAHIIIAHSLIGSFPEVNADKIGITGISWGGNLTSTVMGVDDRFQFAIPVYGCGFLPDADGAQGDAIKSGKHTEIVNKYFDGSAYFGNVKLPTFWLNGTNDKHFSMLSTQQSSQAVNGKSTLRYKIRMPHGHNIAWAPEEIYVFANSIIKNETPLVSLGKPKVKGRSIVARAKTSKTISKVEVNYTLDAGPFNKRQWKTVGASLIKHKIQGNIPKGTTTVYLAITDEDGLMISSEFIEIQ